jgi:uncharacterized protein YjgD (DUF1641 family)
MSSSLAEVDKASFEGLLAKLEDPQTVASLSSLLDHTDLLAVLIVGLDGLVSRSETVGDAIVGSFAELRNAGVAEELKGKAGELAGKNKGLLDDVIGMATDMAKIMPKVAPGLAELAESGLIDEVIASGMTMPATVDRIGQLMGGVASGLSAEPVEVKGVLSLAKIMKDPDVARGIGFTLGLVKAIGAGLSGSKTNG